MAILRNLFDLAGKVNAPDLGISEKLGIGTSKPALRGNAPYGFKPTPVQQQDLLSHPNLSDGPYQGPLIPQTQTYYRQTAPQNPAGIAPSGSTTGGTTGAASGAFSAGEQGRVAGTTTDNGQNIYQETQNRLQREADARNEQFRAQADDIFNPLIENAGNQIGRLGGELATLQGGVESGAQASRDLVAQQLAGSLNQLGQQEGNIRTETGKTLRNLAEDQRNVTTSTARQLGARGAGDTSAGDYAGAAIGRQGLKQRGNALESQATGLREIEGRRFEAQNIANQENTRIEQAKQAQLQSLAQDFQGLQRQLENAKATASSDQRRYIAAQQNKLYADLKTELNKIDTEVRTRKAALADWGTQQETLLNNSLRLIQGKGAYDASDIYGQLSKAGSLAANLGYQATPQGAQYIQETYVPGAPTGLFEPKPQKNEDDAIDQLINSAVGA